MFKEFGKLPLREVTLLVDDREFLEEQKNYHPQHFLDEIELSYRWTLKQKQDFSRDVRDALLARGDAEKGNELGGKAAKRSGERRRCYLRIVCLVAVEPRFGITM